MQFRRHRFPAPWKVLACAALAASLTACGGGSAANAACRGNVAVVDGANVSSLQYTALLRYTLLFYERGNAGSKYYGKRICGDKTLASDCVRIKKQLLQRMIDQTVVANYAAAHNLLATPADWSKALAREQKLIQAAGGQPAFLAYLHKVGTDEAEFRLLESEEIETGKVIKAVGPSRFKAWLASRERTGAVSRCISP